jgi:hypothetical protein
MITSVNNKKKQKNQDYPNTMKKPIPISIVTGGDTIFIKTNPNKLTYNYINNGNQIKNNKFFINSINQSSDFNQSLKNTFSLYKSNFNKSTNGTILESKNLNNSKLHDLFKIKRLTTNVNTNNNTHKRGTNSFIRMNRKKTYNHNNISKISNISKNNSINSSNHNFNFYNFVNKINTSSLKGKSTKKKKLENNKDMLKNIKYKKNNFNYTYITDKNNSKFYTSIIERPYNSKGKKHSTSMNKNSNSKKRYKNNNLTNINLNSRDIFPYLTISTEKENNFSTLKGQLFYPSSKYNNEKRLKNLNKYISSLERKKEKSLAERRYNAKKPISYLIKNNLMHFDKNKNIKNNIIININNINSGLVNNDYSKDRGRSQRLTFNSKRNYFDLSNSSNYYSNNINNRYEDIKNYETDNKIKIKKSRKEYSINTHETINKKLSNLNKKIPFSNKNNLYRSNTNESKISSNSNNIVNNNNYYNINNTFIFDAAGQKLLQYDLTKIMPGSKNNNSMNINITDVKNLQNNLQSSTDKVCKNDIEKNDTIKNINKKIRKDNKIFTKDSYNINKSNHNYISAVINNKNNNNNYNIQKYSSYKLSNIIKNKVSHNNMDIIAHYKKINISNLIKKGSYKTANSTHTNNYNITKHQTQRNNNNNINNYTNNNNNLSKEFVIKEYNNKKKKDKNKTLINNNKKEDINNSLINKNKFYEQKSITTIYNNDHNHNLLYANSLNRRKSDNISNLEQKTKIKCNTLPIHNIIDFSQRNTTNNSVQKDKNKVSKDNNKENKKDNSKSKSKDKIKDIFNNDNKDIKDNKDNKDIKTKKEYHKNNTKFIT